jgi:hypothetical protein
MFIMEGMGMGRGLGAVDLSNDRIKQIYARLGYYK